MNKQTGVWVLTAALVWAPVGLVTTSTAAEPPAGKPVVKKATVQVKLSVNGMTCSGCERKVKAAAMAVPGVKSCEVSYERNEAVITYDSAKTPIERVVTSLEQAGFRASLKDEEI